MRQGGGSQEKSSSWPRHTGIWFSNSKRSLIWKKKFTAPDSGQTCYMAGVPD